MGSWFFLDISLTSTFTNYNFFWFNITVTIDWQQEWFSFFFNSMASYKYGRSILLGKRVTHWGQKTLPFLLREVILKKWCYRVTVNFISTTVVETLACYHEPSPTHLAREDTFGIIIIFDWIVYNKQNLVYCIFLTFFGIFWLKKKKTENCWWNEKLSPEIFSWLPILVGEISLLSFVRQAYLG